MQFKRRSCHRIQPEIRSCRAVIGLLESERAQNATLLTAICGIAADAFCRSHKWRLQSFGRFPREQFHPLPASICVLRTRILAPNPAAVEADDTPRSPQSNPKQFLHLQRGERRGKRHKCGPLPNVRPGHVAQVTSLPGMKFHAADCSHVMRVQWEGPQGSLVRGNRRICWQDARIGVLGLVQRKEAHPSAVFLFNSDRPLRSLAVSDTPAVSFVVRKFKKPEQQAKVFGSEESLQ
jgi:hypothetical protein